MKTRCLSKIRCKISRCYIPNCQAPRPLTEMSQYCMERGCPDDSKKYKLISVRGLWAEQFAIEIDQFYEKLWKFQKSQFSRKCQNLRFNTSISIANCSAHRRPTEMSLYFLESSGPPLSTEYWLISVSCLWAEKLAETKIGWNPPPL